MRCDLVDKGCNGGAVYSRNSIELYADPQEKMMMQAQPP